MPLTRSKLKEIESTNGKNHDSAKVAANDSNETFLDAKLTEFYWLHNEQPHAQRRLDMLKKYPEIKLLMKHEPITKYIVFLEVALQLFVAWYLTKHNMIWTWQFWIIAYVLGGTITSSLVLSIHEVTHFLAFKDPKMNKILACIANLPIVLPFCVEFKRFHMDHHRYQGLDGVDGDLPTYFEARLLNNPVGKWFFVTFQILFYAVRPKLVATPKTYKMPTNLKEWLTSWHALNFYVQVPVMIGIYSVWGMDPIWYLAISVLLGGSLHPMAAHFISEHYVTSPDKQETYSYYGPLNYLAFNVGYHNEHHDFPNIPWTKLPEIRKIAPEFYEDLKVCDSWVWILWEFLTKPGLGPYSRVKRRHANEDSVGDDMKVAKDE